MTSDTERRNDASEQAEQAGSTRAPARRAPARPKAAAPRASAARVTAAGFPATPKKPAGSAAAARARAASTGVAGDTDAQQQTARQKPATPARRPAPKKTAATTTRSGAATTSAASPSAGSPSADEAAAASGAGSARTSSGRTTTPRTSTPRTTTPRATSPRTSTPRTAEPRTTKPRASSTTARQSAAGTAATAAESAVVAETVLDLEQANEVEPNPLDRIEEALAAAEATETVPAAVDTVDEADAIVDAPTEIAELPAEEVELSVDEATELIVIADDPAAAPVVIEVREAESAADTGTSAARVIHPSDDDGSRTEASAESASTDAADNVDSTSALSLDHLVKRFGSTVAVDGVTLEVNRGAFYGIVGPNGAGKTTTLSMITGLVRPDHGTVRVAGHDVWQDPVEAKRMIGVLPDKLRLFDRLTGRQLLHYSGSLRGLDGQTVRERSDELAEAFGIRDALNRLVSDYSAGMTKKVALAAAMIHSPRLLVLDEPFEAVDPVSADTVTEILQSYVAGGGTVVLSSHSMEMIERVCDGVAIIVHGKVLTSGTVDQVSDGSTLEDRFIELAGGHKAVEGMEWLLSSLD